jgi:hypothetical protein
MRAFSFEFFKKINQQGQEAHLKKIVFSSNDYIVRSSTTLVRRKALGGEEREYEHRLIYIHNNLAPELEWLNVKLVQLLQNQRWR